MSSELIARGSTLSIIAELDKRDAEIERLNTNHELLLDDYKQLLGDVEQLRAKLAERDAEIERLREEENRLWILANDRSFEIERLRDLAYHDKDHTKTWKRSFEITSAELAKLIVENARLRKRAVEVVEWYRTDYNGKQLDVIIGALREALGE